jgi:hypothetical protein
MSSPYKRHVKALLRDAEELERARKQECKPEHLTVHIYRVAIHACTQLLAARAAGAPILTPHLLPNSSGLLRVRPGNGDDLLLYWKMAATPWLRSVRPGAFKADAGAYDFASLKTDAQGRILGKDGRARRIVAVSPTGEEIDITDSQATATADPQVGPGWRLEARGPAALRSDDYDDADLLSHGRLMAQDWADACRAAAELLAQAEKTPGSGAQPRKLNATEKRILAHCRRRAHKGERIAIDLGLTYDHVRRILAKLVKEGRLKNTDRGYHTV